MLNPEAPAFQYSPAPTYYFSPAPPPMQPLQTLPPLPPPGLADYRIPTCRTSPYYPISYFVYPSQLPLPLPPPPPPPTTTTTYTRPFPPAYTVPFPNPENDLATQLAEMGIIPTTGVVGEEGQEEANMRRSHHQYISYHTTSEEEQEEEEDQILILTSDGGAPANNNIPTPTRPLPPAPPRPCNNPLQEARSCRSRGNRGLIWLPTSGTSRSCSSTGEEKRRNLKSYIFPSSHSSSSSSSSFYSLFEFDELQPGAGDKTTVMIKNIPNKYRVCLLDAWESSREMLIELLDKHCVQENQKALLDTSSPPLSEYDFLYLPMDFKNKCNLGYAFVNFTTAAAAWRLYRSLHRRKWDVFDSKKISHICFARIQGKSELVEKFKCSNFRCDSDEFLPAILSPPRNGSSSCPPPTSVGRRLPLR